VKIRKYDPVYVKFYDHFRAKVSEEELDQVYTDNIIAAVGFKLRENRKYLYLAQTVGSEIQILAIYKPAIIKIVKLEKKEKQTPQ